MADVVLRTGVGGGYVVVMPPPGETGTAYAVGTEAAVAELAESGQHLITDALEYSECCALRARETASSQALGAG